MSRDIICAWFFSLLFAVLMVGVFYGFQFEKVCVFQLFCFCVFLVLLKDLILEREANSLSLFGYSMQLIR